MKVIRILAVFLALFIGISAMSISFDVEAASVYIRPKKSVFLVMDDSGSMCNSSENDANYALQTFLAVLDKDEEVNIYFLNDSHALHDIDISKKSNNMLADVRVNYPEAIGGTPFDAVERAAKDLRKAAKNDASREYWLVVIADGDFTSGNPQNYMETFTQTPLKNGNYPNFLYVGIGGGEAFIVPQGAENRFFLEVDNSVINAMNNAVVHITNRQIVNAKNADSKTISIDLPYPARNIVVLAQTYDTKIVSQKSSSKLNINETYKIQYPVLNPDLQYSTVCYVTESSGSSIKSGKIDFTFDQEIKADNLVVMVEPAIGINAVYYGEGGKGIDPSNMRVGEKITVKMTVCDSETNAPLDSVSGFGDVVQYITVNGTKYDGDTVEFVVPEENLDVNMFAEFSDGFVLDVFNNFSNLVAKRDIQLFVSDSGYFEEDINQLNNSAGIVVTPLVNGSNFTAEELENTKLTVNGGGFFTNRFKIKMDQQTGTYIIYPKAGFLKIFTPTEEQTFEIEFFDGNTSAAENLMVKITGKRPFGIVIVGILLLLLCAYTIWVEVTRKRFPKGTYVKYYNVDNEGAPDANLTDRVFLNKPSLEKLKNGSYAFRPNATYKVRGEEGCEDIVFVASSKTHIKVEGVSEVTIDDDYGYPIKTTTYVPINKYGDKLTTQAPVEDETKLTSLFVSYGSYLRKADFRRCIRISTKNHDNEIGENHF